MATLEVMTSPNRLILALGAVAVLVHIGTSVAIGADVTKKGPDRFVGLIFKDPRETEFLKAVLRSMSLEYTVKATPDGELVEWPSNDPAQELEIQNRVSQFWFILTRCSGMRPPSPAQPARARLSC